MNKAICSSWVNKNNNNNNNNDIYGKDIWIIYYKRVGSRENNENIYISPSQWSESLKSLKGNTGNCQLVSYYYYYYMYRKVDQHKSVIYDEII